MVLAGQVMRWNEGDVHLLLMIAIRAAILSSSSG